LNSIDCKHCRGHKDTDTVNDDTYQFDNNRTLNDQKEKQNGTRRMRLPG
jgi:hypothetical protein